MACTVKKPAQALRIVIQVLRSHVIPTSYPLGDESVIAEIPLSGVDWEVRVYPALRRRLQVDGCCLKSLRPQDLTQSRLLSDLAVKVAADLKDCDSTESAPLRRTTKKKSRGTTKKKSRATTKKKARK